MAPKYLYAAAVQGIQDFIFQTNKLQDIAGASELVEQICTQEFKKAFLIEQLQASYDANQLLVGAAGNIKYLFDESEKELCEKIFKNFPMQIAKLAPGITISQTVVIIENGDISSSHINTAEGNLKIQRNLPTRPLIAAMIAKRTATTGKPAIEQKGGEWIDDASKKKAPFFEKGKISLFNNIVPDNLNEILSFDNKGLRMTADDNSWLAVVHADGNDLGKLIPQFFGGITGGKFIKLQKELSSLLDICTKEATKNAIAKVLGNKDVINKLVLFKDKLLVPIRPILCGGDDLTVIIQAAYAVDFTKAFLEEFTEETKKQFASWAEEVDKEKTKKTAATTPITVTADLLANGLTACAGIAFVKEKYPFHYAVALADDLCKHAKNEAKKVKKKGQVITPACFSFYKIESAFVRSYDEIQKHELVTSIKLSKNDESDEDAKKMTLSACPYYLQGEANAQNTATKLKDWVQAAKDYPAVRSRLRQVLSMLHTSENLGDIKLELARIQTLNPRGFKAFDITADNLAHLHDFLSLNSIS
jgi:predicted phosphoribosyltransferase